MSRGDARWLQLVGWSDSGKTRVLEAVTALLSLRGVRVLAVKYTHHPVAEPAKDTGRLTEAGARATVLWGPDLVRVEARQIPLGVVVRWTEPDWIVVEGGRGWPTPKVLVGLTGWPPARDPVVASLGPLPPASSMHWPGRADQDPEGAARWLLDRADAVTGSWREIEGEALAHDVD
jgi:molybdopterin-guanine dinucleotide biosynthesis protein MobB